MSQPTQKALAKMWFEMAEILEWPRVRDSVQRRVMLDALKVMLDS